MLDDTGIVRTDHTVELGSSSGTAEGIYMQLTITVVNVNGSCAPLEGYAVYIWHCTPRGLYSLYTVPGENYLRGVGVTDANGQVTFTSIFPGCYDGRFPPILSRSIQPGQGDQLCQSRADVAARDADGCLQHGLCDSGYSSSKTNFAKITTSSDNVFGDNTSARSRR
ncbi:intradiol ring-cleavage dioxygenase [Sphingobium yanoikuyae]|uniref:dioxygenase family protein n=1 Tax=Sphingobium yanoikuyae TaxID=13690 RepID=UPI00345E88D0